MMDGEEGGLFTWFVGLYMGKEIFVCEFLRSWTGEMLWESLFTLCEK